ncbi:MAG: 23S rRNA (adenine(2030)-N(6))-methyltransferase RlmJ [Gammaproteobacteria bacterium]|jgi:23S rRNA (adenine2030-N6)-methyltransferase
MNYRHIFHAGNFADVAKHVGLVCLLERLAAKGKPFAYVETHAGAGRYDLSAGEARRSGEADHGIRELASGPAPGGAIGRYLELIRSFQPRSGGIEVYPGSPMIAQQMMGESDRALVCEIDPGQSRLLRQNLAGDRRFGVHHRDGYEAPQALLPPMPPLPRRGVVLIDPPYEDADELKRLFPALEKGGRRWPTGIFMVWYPIKHRRELRGFYRSLVATRLGPVLLAELMVRPADSGGRLNGSGLAIIRPPWRFDRDLSSVWPDLARRLGGDSGRADVRWLSRAGFGAPDRPGRAKRVPRRAAGSGMARQRS